MKIFSNHSETLTAGFCRRGSLSGARIYIHCAKIATPRNLQIFVLLMARRALCFHPSFESEFTELLSLPPPPLPKSDRTQELARRFEPSRAVQMSRSSMKGDGFEQGTGYLPEALRGVARNHLNLSTTFWITAFLMWLGASTILASSLQALRIHRHRLALRCGLKTSV